MVNAVSERPLNCCHFTLFHHEKHCLVLKTGFSIIGGNQYNLKCFFSLSLLVTGLHRMLKDVQWQEWNKVSHLRFIKAWKAEICFFGGFFCGIFWTYFCDNDPACIDHSSKEGSCSRFPRPLIELSWKKEYRHHNRGTEFWKTVTTLCLLPGFGGFVCYLDSWAKW